MKFVTAFLVLFTFGFSSFAQVSGRLTKEQWELKRDSMRRVFAIKTYESALERFEALKVNTRKDTLKVLDLSDLRLTEFPKLVMEFPNVEVLDISGNAFYKLPKEIKQVKTLKTLIWNTTDFEQVRFKPNKRFKKFKLPRKIKLEKIYLAGNGFTRVPKMVRRIKGLEYLGLANNQIVGTPKNLRKIEKLEVLNLDANPIDPRQVRFTYLPSKLEILKLNKCDLDYVTREIYESNVIDLQLRENNLKELPEGIAKMKRLRKLSLYKNKLQKLPDDFYDLKKLNSLDLYYNQINHISKEISTFDSLRILYLAFNKLYEIPEEIGQMRNLRELYLHHNQLNAIPESFRNLHSLKVFRINDNNLPEFPLPALGMKSLEYLDVGSNLLETLPEELIGLDQLDLFVFDKNQINLQSVENRHIAPMISDMVESGVNCTPSITREVTEEEN